MEIAIIALVVVVIAAKFTIKIVPQQKRLDCRAPGQIRSHAFAWFQRHPPLC